MTKSSGLKITMPKTECASCAELRDELRIKDEVNKLLRADIAKLRARRCAVYSDNQHNGMPKMIGIVHMFRDNGGKTRMVVEDIDGKMHQVDPECVRMIEKQPEAKAC